MYVCKYFVRITNFYSLVFQSQLTDFISGISPVLQLKGFVKLKEPSRKLLLDRQIQRYRFTDTQREEGRCADKQLATPLYRNSLNALVFLAATWQFEASAPSTDCLQYIKCKSDDTGHAVMSCAHTGQQVQSQITVKQYTSRHVWPH